MITKARIIINLALAVVAVLTLMLPVALSGCGSGSSDSGGGGSKTITGAGTVEVHMKNNAFDPKETTIDKGATVKWINDDSVQHTVTAGDKSFDSGMLNSAQTYERTFNEPGTFDYLCTIHPSMKGKVTVR